MASPKPPVITSSKQPQVCIDASPTHPHSPRNSSEATYHKPAQGAAAKGAAVLRPSDAHLISQSNVAPRKALLKRKLSGSEGSTDRTLVELDVPVLKKPKVMKSGKGKESASRVKKVKPSNASDEYPEGYFYCHQCNKKRDNRVGLQCTLKESKNVRCKAKYCKPCLKNRYGLELEAIRAKGESTPRDKAHIAGQGYTFKCPKCHDACNCLRCRKLKGLGPTGNLTHAARRSGVGSVADILMNDPDATGILGGKGSQVSKEPRIRETKADPTSAQVKSAKASVKSQRQVKVKVLPKPAWTSIDIPLSLEEVEDRIHIREFVLRFSTILDMTRTHLDELEEFKGVLSIRRAAEDDDDEVVPWVSEACVKSLIIALLGLLEVGGEIAKMVKDTIKEIRGGGGNLNKIWSELSMLRDSWHATAASTNNGLRLTFVDPLPPPSSVNIHQTRSGLAQKYVIGVNVARSAQLVPVISALVNLAVDSEAIRTEIETGVQAGKDMTRDAREAHRKENERLEKQKNEIGDKTKKDRSISKAHKRIMADIDHAFEVASYAQAPRFTPLGRDVDGRIYFILSPGMAEREFALEYLNAAARNETGRQCFWTARGKKRIIPSTEDRSAFKKWSWFVAVWGKRPSPDDRAPFVKPEMDESDDEDSDFEDKEDEEQWWGFWQPEEVFRLASWIASKRGLVVSERTDEPKDKAHATDQTPTSSAGPRLPSLSGLDDEDSELSNIDDSEDEDDSNVSAASDANFDRSPRASIQEIKALTSALQDYASLLEWRLTREGDNS